MGQIPIDGVLKPFIETHSGLKPEFAPDFRDIRT